MLLVRRPPMPGLVWLLPDLMAGLIAPEPGPDDLASPCLAGFGGRGSDMREPTLLVLGLYPIFFGIYLLRFLGRLFLPSFRMERRPVGVSSSQRLAICGLLACIQRRWVSDLKGIYVPQMVLPDIHSNMHHHGLPASRRRRPSMEHRTLRDLHSPIPDSPMAPKIRNVYVASWRRTSADYRTP